MRTKLRWIIPLILVSTGSLSRAEQTTCVDLSGRYQAKSNQNNPYQRIFIKQTNCDLLYFKVWYKTFNSEPLRKAEYWIKINSTPKVEFNNGLKISTLYSWDNEGLLQSTEIIDSDSNSKHIFYNRLFLVGNTLVQSSDSTDPLTGEPEFSSYEYTRSNF